MSLISWTFDQNGTSELPLQAGHYRELVLSGDASFSEDSGEAHRQYLVNWDEHRTFISDLMGYAEIGGASGVTRTLPDRHPEFPLYAISCSRKGVTPASVVGNRSDWTFAKIDAVYRPVDYFVSVDDPTTANELYRFVSRRTLPKGDYLQLATNAFTWQITGNNLGVVPGIIVPTRTLEYTWHMVPSKVAGDANQVLRCPVEDTILSTLGTTNNEVFDGVYQVGTVLFVAAEATPIPPRFNDLHHWKIRYFFECKDHGFVPATGERAGVNYLFNPATNSWDVPQVAATGQRLYGYASLNSLFRIA